MGIVDGTVETAGGGLIGGVKWGLTGLAIAATIVVGGAALFAFGGFTLAAAAGWGAAASWGAAATGGIIGGILSSFPAQWTAMALTAVGVTTGAAKGLTNNISRSNDGLEAQIAQEQARSEQLSIAERQIAERQRAASGFNNPAATIGHKDALSSQNIQTQKPQMTI